MYQLFILLVVEVLDCFVSVTEQDVLPTPNLPRYFTFMFLSHVITMWKLKHCMHPGQVFRINVYVGLCVSDIRKKYLDPEKLKQSKSTVDEFSNCMVS